MAATEPVSAEAINEKLLDSISQWTSAPGPAPRRPGSKQRLWAANSLGRVFALSSALPQQAESNHGLNRILYLVSRTALGMQIACFRDVNLPLLTLLDHLFLDSGSFYACLSTVNYIWNIFHILKNKTYVIPTFNPYFYQIMRRFEHPAFILHVRLWRPTRQCEYRADPSFSCLYYELQFRRW